MKRIILSALLLLSIGLSAIAQTKKTAAKKKTTLSAKTNNKTSTVKKQTANQVVLVNTGSYKAYAQSATNMRLQISDPIVRTLDAKAEGANIRVSNSGIVGMPRGSYGFANGKIKLYNTVATTPGGITGSGTVGTGSHPGSIGTGANAISVNGKSPYAGSGMWGWNNSNPLPVDTDSSQRRIDVKQRD